jgi:hypothetical protein
MRPSINYILFIILFATISGCFQLPAPTTESLDDHATVLKPVQTGEKVLIYGFNATRYKYFGEPYFSMGCMLDYTNDTEEDFIRLVLKLNPAPGQFAVIRLDEIVGEEPMVSFKGPSSPPINISVATAINERLRYVILLRETIDTSLHIPLYIIPFGISACSNIAILEATVWEVPSGEMIGSITATSNGEFVGLAWIFHVVFMPETQNKAKLMLVKGILEKLTGMKPTGN